ncbi:MAG: metallophosphoesterase [Phycisphaerae bacterium]|nr:metallophosphoesterase [Phycisphaerae bacterium]
MSLLLGGDLVWWRWANRALRTRFARVALGSFILIQLGYMLTILLGAFVPRHDSNLFVVWGFCLAYAWHLLVLPATLIVFGISWLWRKWSESSNLGQNDHLSGEPRVSRRDVLRTAMIAMPPLVAVGGMALGASELFRFRVRSIVVPLRSLPRALDGMTIAHVSDPHIGRFTNDYLLDAIVERANALNADLTLFAGDLIDVALADLPVAIRFAKRLRARYGVYFCQGNHDLIEDRSHKTNIFETETLAAGLNMLFDDAATIRVRDVPVQILGVRWYASNPTRIQHTNEVMALRDSTAFGICLAHHPHVWDNSTTPLTIAGHTHGGQLMLNERLGVGPVMFRYWSGLYTRGDQALVVSNGTGNWFPIRTMAPAEIIHITLKCV